MDDKIERSIKLHAPIFKVWDALTDYQKFGEWFQVKIEKPFKEGAEARGQITYPGFEHRKWKVKIQQMVPNQLFSFTWHPYAVDTKQDYSTETPTLVEFKLQETPDGTMLKVTEAGFDKLPKIRAVEAFQINGNGWLDQLKNIELYLTTH